MTKYFYPLLALLIMWMQAPLQAHAGDFTPGETLGDTLYNQTHADLNALKDEIVRLQLSAQDFPSVYDQAETFIQQAIQAMTEENSQVARYTELCKQELNALYEEGLGYSAAYDKKYEELMQNPIANAQALIQLYENYKKQLDELDKKREASINTYSNNVAGCAQRLKGTLQTLQNGKTQIEQLIEECRKLQELYYNCETEWQKLSADIQQSEAGAALQQCMNNALNGLSSSTLNTFDCMKLYRLLKEALESLKDYVTGVSEAAVQRNPYVTVHSLDGQLLFTRITRSEAARKLPQGIYLLNKRKVYLP